MTPYRMQASHPLASLPSKPHEKTQNKAPRGRSESREIAAIEALRRKLEEVALVSNQATATVPHVAKARRLGSAVRSGPATTVSACVSPESPPHCTRSAQGVKEVVRAARPTEVRPMAALARPKALGALQPRRNSSEAAPTEIDNRLGRQFGAPRK